MTYILIVGFVRGTVGANSGIQGPFCATRALYIGLVRVANC